MQGDRAESPAQPGKLRVVTSDRQTERQTDRQTGRQTDRQTDRQTCRQTGRQTNSRLSCLKIISPSAICSVWQRNITLLGDLQTAQGTNWEVFWLEHEQSLALDSILVFAVFQGMELPRPYKAQVTNHRCIQRAMQLISCFSSNTDRQSRR